MAGQKFQEPPATEILLAKWLEEQEKERSRPQLFWQGKFKLLWRAKVGSSHHPDLDTIVSAGEPCGRFDWRSQPHADQLSYDGEHPKRTEEYKKEHSKLKNFQLIGEGCWKELPLNGYIPGSAIRGIVRAWAMKNADPKDVIRLLGYQEPNNDAISPGIIEFLDAWPETSTKLKLDVVNPQENFQVYHDNTEQPAPHALYTLGDSGEEIDFVVAIRGIPGKVDAQGNDVKTVAQWVKSALATYGLGGRTSAGYGTLKSGKSDDVILEPGYSIKSFNFELYSQGCMGPLQGREKRDDGKNIEDWEKQELRPTHWRGWLRSWTLRFFLGVMSEAKAKAKVEELFGTLESTDDKQHRQGCVRIQLRLEGAGGVQGEQSKYNEDTPFFYIWKGQLQINAPSKILSGILLPIVKFAASVGGVGRGWRRPLHFFRKDGKSFSRGAYLELKEVGESVPYQVPLDQREWMSLYQTWENSVRNHFTDCGNPVLPDAEAFSPRNCAVYVVPGPDKEPIDFKGNRPPKSKQSPGSSASALQRGARPPKPSLSKKAKTHRTEPSKSDKIQWATNYAGDTRGEGMGLIYSTDPYEYKRNPAVGGIAAGGNSKSHCSWVSIRRTKTTNQPNDLRCQEVVCLFFGKRNNDRRQFARDLADTPHSKHLFGIAGESLKT